MDPRLNPYSPGAGRRPRSLAGRERDIEAFDVLADRAQAGDSAQPIVFSGLRGVGKTVLLNELAGNADQRDWITARIEADHKDGRSTFRNDVAKGLSTSLRKVRGGGTAKAKLAAALKTFKSFTLGIPGGFSFGIDVDPERGRADSGDLYNDLTDLAIDLGGAAADIGTGVALFVDELQDLATPDMSALCRACHEATQRDIPFFVIGAGLPNLPGLLSNSESYAERLFEYRRIDRLSAAEAAQALVVPSSAAGLDWTSEAIDAVFNASTGYPFFLQQFGQSIWDAAFETPVELSLAEFGIREGLAKLDAGFFDARWDRATPSERDYLSAMSQDGERSSATGDVAKRLGKLPQSIGPTRAGLIAKGIAYSPEYGQIAFTVPGMAEFIKRQHR